MSRDQTAGLDPTDEREFTVVSGEQKVSVAPGPVYGSGF